MINFGRTQQGLGGNAAPVQANAAQMFLFHQGNVHAQLRCPDRGHVATWPTAYDDQIKFLFRHGSSLIATWSWGPGSGL